MVPLGSDSPKERPEEHEHTMTFQCHRCGDRNLRPAHLRWTDLAGLFILRLPVRCRYCRARFYVSVLKIGRIRHEAAAQRAREQRHAHVTSRTPETPGSPLMPRS
jgi:hypothetical protein